MVDAAKTNEGMKRTAVESAERLEGAEEPLKLLEDKADIKEITAFGPGAAHSIVEPCAQMLDGSLQEAGNPARAFLRLSSSSISCTNTRYYVMFDPISPNWIGETMPKCSRCGKRGLFLSVNERGICPECAANDSKKRKTGTNKSAYNSSAESSSSSYDSGSRESLVLNWLAKEDRFVRRGLIENKNCPVYVLRHYEIETWRDTQENYPLDNEVEYALCSNRNTSPSWLGNYYRKTLKARWPVASNPSTPQWALDDIFEKGQAASRSNSDSPAVEALEWLAMNPNIRPEWRRFFLAPNCRLFNSKSLVARNPSTTENELIKFVHNRGCGNYGAIPNCFANPNLSRRAIVSNGFLDGTHGLEDMGDLVIAHIGGSPNLTESDLLGILECLSVLDGKSPEEKARMLEHNHAHILQDGLRETIGAVIRNPSASEAVHRRIINACYETSGRVCDPYGYDSGYCTEKAPSAIIETLARDYNVMQAVQRAGAPKKVLEEYFHAEGKFGPYKRGYAVRNPDFPRLFLREPEKDAYIMKLANHHQQRTDN